MGKGLVLVMEPGIADDGFALNAWMMCEKAGVGSRDGGRGIGDTNRDGGRGIGDGSRGGGRGIGD